MSALRSFRRGGLVGLWHSLRIARLQRRHAQLQSFIDRERCLHADQMRYLRDERDELQGRLDDAVQQAAEYWRATR